MNPAYVLVAKLPSCLLRHISLFQQNPILTIQRAIRRHWFERPRITEAFYTHMVKSLPFFPRPTMVRYASTDFSRYHVLDGEFWCCPYKHGYIRYIQHRRRYSRSKLFIELYRHKQWAYSRVRSNKIKYNLMY